VTTGVYVYCLAPNVTGMMFVVQCSPVSTCMSCTA